MHITLFQIINTVTGSMQAKVPGAIQTYGTTIERIGIETGYSKRYCCARDYIVDISRTNKAKN